MFPYLHAIVCGLFGFIFSLVILVKLGITGFIIIILALVGAFFIGKWCFHIHRAQAFVLGLFVGFMLNVIIIRIISDLFSPKAMVFVFLAVEIVSGIATLYQPRQAILKLTAIIGGS